MAEIVLLDRLLSAGVVGVKVSSAGVSAEEQGNPMDYRAVQILRQHGYGSHDTPEHREVAARISSHTAHRVTDTELADADLILAMTRGHYRELLQRAASVDGAGTIRMYREFDPLVSAAGAGADAGAGAADSSGTGLLLPQLDVPDPWYGDMSDFAETLKTVERVSDTLTLILTT